MMARRSLLVMLTVFLWAGSALAGESPVGRWSTIDEKTGKVTSEVKLYEQDGKLFGKIASSARTQRC